MTVRNLYRGDVGFVAVPAAWTEALNNRALSGQPADLIGNPRFEKHPNLRDPSRAVGCGVCRPGLAGEVSRRLHVTDYRKVFGFGVSHGSVAIRARFASN